jgi:hypothetical protein
MVDDLGKAETTHDSPAAALRYDRSGHQVAMELLRDNIYRIDANPLGRGMIALSDQCVIHAYNDALQPIVRSELANAPEVQAARRRLGIEDARLKNHVRCVALSRDLTRFLFTIVDEAWCVTADGRRLWGIRLPMKDGWTRVAEPSPSYGTSQEIQQALSLMGTSLPFAPEDLKKRYWHLAKDLHPDLNPGDPFASDRMKALNGAMELLSGIKDTALPDYTGVRYVQELSRTQFSVHGINLTLTMSYGVSEISAVDWIYAASFAGTSHAAFLATYSGRVIALSETGAPLRAYDIGAVPRRIVDTGDFLYFLTDTRLYVLRGDTLHAIIDTYQAGDLFVAQTGFGLLEKKRFRWFREDGSYLGTILARDPIRRVYCASGALAIETRTRRAIVHGPPQWWET